MAKLHHSEGHRLAELSTAVRESSLKRLRRVPPNRAHWRPLEDTMSFADVAYHLLQADQWLSKKLEDPRLTGMTGHSGDASNLSEEDFEALLGALEESGKQRAAMLQALSDAALESRMYDDRFDRRVTVWWVVMRGTIDHEIHHRGQISVYLRLLQTELGAAKLPLR
jgi:uncharacterized damage-inducible protein DinB